MIFFLRSIIHYYSLVISFDDILDLCIIGPDDE